MMTSKIGSKGGNSHSDDTTPIGLFWQVVSRKSKRVGVSTVKTKAERCPEGCRTTPRQSLVKESPGLRRMQ